MRTVEKIVFRGGKPERDLVEFDPGASRVSLMFPYTYTPEDLNDLIAALVEAQMRIESKRTRAEDPRQGSLPFVKRVGPENPS